LIGAPQFATRHRSPPAIALWREWLARSFDGITIEEAGKSFLTRYPGQPLHLYEPGYLIYALKRNGWNGFILGGIASHNADDEIATAPSALIRVVLVRRRDSSDDPVLLESVHDLPVLFMGKIVQITRVSDHTAWTAFPAALPYH
jgi:hypothetical protein